MHKFVNLSRTKPEVDIFSSLHNLCTAGRKPSSQMTNCEVSHSRNRVLTLDPQPQNLQQGDVSKLLDLTRQTIVYDDISSLYDGLKAICDDPDVVVERVKNRCEQPFDPQTLNPKPQNRSKTCASNPLIPDSIPRHLYPTRPSIPRRA
jgi:hypothetical protein